ncbi:hypothetical protein FA09DRAFT_50894 [Tilletiopsis washingtonensis]|uniref:Uncharacterized protein n=1 Tax=Tilletiopsis washingtonensis TaxID=58919 RepID=A0A316Z708_9BASI|nr:hypothetical protein FA09DRAFT_50894 [Tilletiopsis washingtonensis]PWN97351.1 hypothetical protein FA09DRAFT_50894 [Tilletiopsis washingtonensis]
MHAAARRFAPLSRHERAAAPHPCKPHPHPPCQGQSALSKPPARSGGPSRSRGAPMPSKHRRRASAAAVAEPRRRCPAQQQTTSQRSVQRLGSRCRLPRHGSCSTTGRASTRSPAASRAQQSTSAAD